jgi:hypothetical protein
MRTKKATLGERQMMGIMGCGLAVVRGCDFSSGCAAIIDRMIARERRKERERCAKAVVAYRSGVSFEPIRFACDDILAAIRGANP